MYMYIYIYVYVYTHRFLLVYPEKGISVDKTKTSKLRSQKNF